ncbi:hypothetical protein, partial [Planomonospora algeriensis]
EVADAAAGLARRVQGELARAFGVGSLSVVLVERGGVGRTTSGKIQRSRTRELLLTGLLPVVHAELTGPVRDALAAAGSATGSAAGSAAGGAAQGVPGTAQQGEGE